ncbi:hypothetical protein GCM10010911_55500 [Paenibacillus nasutitermitis]|uniref:Uncharacterized protein n=1 Tax=Paenibacillus nasutitermitis TaxID=1652958 RepID=A0A917E1H7_9BACL|nr:hypothetical protein GCM10010911_55500 [Paenibacillus nasutitermitis]
MKVTKTGAKYSQLPEVEDFAPGCFKVELIDRKGTVSTQNNSNRRG